MVCKFYLFVSELLNRVVVVVLILKRRRVTMVKSLMTFRLIPTTNRTEADICKGMPVIVKILKIRSVLLGRLKISVLRRCLLLSIR